MNDPLDTILPSDEDTTLKVWCEPALTEYDVDDVTAIGAVTNPDGGITSS